MKQKNTHLEEIGDKTVFKVPENYFENFQYEFEKRLYTLNTENIQLEERKPTESKPKGFVIKMESIKPIFFMAAMFILLIFCVSLVLNYTSDRSSYSLRLSAESKTPPKSTVIPTAEDYLINSIGADGITEYYMESESFE